MNLTIANKLFSEGTETLGQNASMHMSTMSEVPEPPSYIFVVSAIFFLLIFFVGMVGNILIIGLVCGLKYMRTRMGLLFMNLSITDILILTICMPSAAVDLYAKEVWYFGEAVCKLVPFLENAVTLASVLTILAITIDRYYGICSPTSDNEWKRFKVAQKVIGIWTVACLCSAPMFLIVEFKDSTFYDGTPIKVCRQPIDRIWKIAYILSIFFVFFFVILIILLLLILRMAMFLLHQTNLFEGQNKERQRNSLRSRRKVVAMLLFVVICFFICLLPQRVAGIWFIFAERHHIYELGLEGYLNLLTSTRMLMYLNSALNPVIYNSMSTKVRRVMSSFLQKWNRRRHKHMGYDSCNRHTATTPGNSPSLSSKHGVNESVLMSKIQLNQRKTKSLNSVLSVL